MSESQIEQRLDDASPASDAQAITIVDMLGAVDTRALMLEDVRRGLLASPKELPPKYFYDERGSQLFETICMLPEYYQTRTEAALLESMIDEVVARHAPRSLAELGSGSSTKTRVILDAMRRAGTLLEYSPIDLSREILLESARALCGEYPGLHVRAVVADFDHELPAMASPGPELLIFLGGTIGNFGPDAARALLGRLRAGMRADDLFLLGVDLVKSPSILNPAYDDAAGVTAEFNLNVLRVINERLGADFDLDAFEHYAFYEPVAEQIEMHLLSTRDQVVTIPDLGAPVAFYRGESVRTEISRKFRRASATAMLEGAGFDVVEWYVDAKALFGLVLARPT